MFENEKEYQSYLDGMDQYIEKLKRLQKEDLEAAQANVRDSLINAGLFKKDGTPRKKIIR